MQTLEQLAILTEQALEERDYQQAQAYAWQQVDADPLRETAVRQLMTALAKSGQRSAAMAQYEIYSKRLDEALGVEPSSELIELYRSIQADELQHTVLRSQIQVPQDTTTINPIFCYTDIESSTRLWDEHREAMFGALLQHNDICETEIERFQGRILHPTGDGFLIVFEQNDPLQFAISLQQKMAEADWGEIGDLRIRIGLHGTTADQEGHEFFREGGWYRGSILNHAARISDTGHGGQIVASPFVKEKCSLPPGASWQDLGEYSLKSLDDKQQILGLMHPDLPLKEFPPLRTPENKKAAQVDGKIRGYQLGQKIGQGAFGDVYRAVQPGIGRPVAVKIIRSLYANQPRFHPPF